jgi:glycosyltransferase involved in cell wall biosynthesis
MSKIKVAHILHCVGGVDVYLRLILENINPEKIESIVVHGKNDTQNIFYDQNKVKVNSYKIPIYRKISLIQDVSAIFQAYKIIKKERPNVIHCHSAKGGIIGRIIGRLLSIKVLYTPHAFSYLSAESKWKCWLYLFIEKQFANKNSILVPTSVSEFNRGEKEVGYFLENIRLFTNSIPQIKISSAAPIFKPGSNKYICSVGRPSYQKNIELMIQVFFEVRKTTSIDLVIIGVGLHSDRLKSVKQLISKLNLEHCVTLLDWTEQKNVWHIIQQSELYLSTSRYEGLPYSVIEALSLSKPCVVSDCDGNRDLIENDYNGFVIPNENILEYAMKINLLLNDTRLLQLLSENAIKSFKKNYDLKKNIPILEQIYIDYSLK